MCHAERSSYGTKQKVPQCCGKRKHPQLRQVTSDVDSGAYIAPCAMKLSEWLAIWLAEYLTGRSPLTVSSYESNCRNYIIPMLGRNRLDAITPVVVQHFVNELAERSLSPKTVKNIHGVLHRALQQAVLIGYLRTNPAAVCNLPKGQKPQIKPLNDEQIAQMISELTRSGHPFAPLYIVTLFTGMRQGEALGLQWEDVDFRRGTIFVRRQLRKLKGRGKGYEFAAPKDHDSRIIKPANAVMALLRQQRTRQREMQLAAGPAWNNPDELIFTNEFGRHLTHITVYKSFKWLVAELGFPTSRFHDLRHTYAVVSLENGDDIKTVQENLGHATAAFTLDVYGHVSDRMRKESAERMDKFIHTVSSL